MHSPLLQAKVARSRAGGKPIERRPDQGRRTMLNDHLLLSRRRLLQSGTAALAAGMAAPGFAKAPPRGTQAPYFYRFKVGSAEATIVSDGPLPLGDPHKNFLGLSATEMDK